jgi:hypothetical protein
LQTGCLFGATGFFGALSALPEMDQVTLETFTESAEYTGESVQGIAGAVEINIKEGVNDGE